MNRFVLMYGASVALFFLLGYLVRPFADRWLERRLSEKGYDEIVERKYIEEE